MRVYFISIWPSDSGLSHATVHPHLGQLASDPRVDEIVYFSVEAEPVAKYEEATGKVAHCPVVLDKVSIPILSRALRHWTTSFKIRAMAANKRPDLVICRGAPAGIYGYLLWKRLGTPYYVESFEPHAEYMRQSGTWSRFDIKYLVQRRWETIVKKTASGLITVSEGYAKYLAERESIPQKILLTVPCWISAEKFFFNIEARELVRKRLGIKNALVCIYLGKFGGLYHQPSILRTLKTLSRATKSRFFVIILTPENKMKVSDIVKEIGFHDSDFLVDFVPPDQVNDYLCAADFAVSFIASGPWSFACSAIKHSEYWAAGLPVLIPGGVGDESVWLEQEKAGAFADFFDESSLESAMGHIVGILNDAGHREKIREVALARRGKSHLIEAYKEIIDSVYGSTTVMASLKEVD